jgi:hypothetical protein
MSMSESDRDALIQRWIQKSSDTEQERMERAERMVHNAIDAYEPFDGYRRQFRVYAKGSYRNETNVRLESDVDIVVESHDSFYDDFLNADLEAAAAPDPSWRSYQGPWVPTAWRDAVGQALTDYFGSSEVDRSGEVAITISEKAGSRPATDVVPAFRYVRYDSADRRLMQEGSKIFKKSGGDIVNYPQQQLENGQAKDRRTSGRYKMFARALKNGENALVKADLMKPKPSYFMECLAYNVPNEDLRHGSTNSAWFRWNLAWLYNELLPSAYAYEKWSEPNELKYLFWSGNKWSIDDGRELTHKLWDFLDFE